MFRKGGSVPRHERFTSSLLLSGISIDPESDYGFRARKAGLLKGTGCWPDIRRLDRVMRFSESATTSLNRLQQLPCHRTKRLYWLEKE
jgi:hypothetical protein